MIPTLTSSFFRLAGSLLLAALLATPATAAGPPDWLLGEWVLNSLRTHELQPKQSAGGGGGFGTPSISVGGVAIPLPGGNSGGGGGGAATDPGVLRCERMSVSMQEGNVRFVYDGSGEETMKPGNDQGRKTSWSRGKLSQKYTTTARSVTKTYELDRDGYLLVRVKLNPKGAKGATHVRVFERPPG